MTHGSGPEITMECKSGYPSDQPVRLAVSFTAKLNFLRERPSRNPFCFTLTRVKGGARDKRTMQEILLVLVTIRNSFGATQPFEIQAMLVAFHRPSVFCGWTVWWLAS